MEGAQKKKPWMRRHHRVVRDIAYLVLHRYTVRRYGIDIEKFSAQGERAYLILMNHQTAFDQFFVGMTFKGPVYYVASEDLFSNGFISTLLRWAVAPIPIKKQTSDISAVKNCIRVAKEGGTIAIAPEGNRPYSGRTGYMNPAIAALAKLIKLPIAFLRIEGGYGVHPRWSDAVRKGHMRCYVSRVMEPEEFKSLSKQELHEVIERELYEDEGTADAEFDSDVRAEFLERAMYVCPWCGLSEFESRGNYIECKKCRRKVEYGKDKRLRGQGFDFPFARSSSTGASGGSKRTPSSASTATGWSSTARAAHSRISPASRCSDATSLISTWAKSSGSSRAESGSTPSNM